MRPAGVYGHRNPGTPQQGFPQRGVPVAGDSQLQGLPQRGEPPAGVTGLPDGGEHRVTLSDQAVPKFPDFPVVGQVVAFADPQCGGVTPLNGGDQLVVASERADSAGDFVDAHGCPFGWRLRC